MQDWIIGIMNQFGYLGIAILIAIENIFPPIPSEVILTFAGFMTSYTQTSLIGMIAFSTIGSVLGAIVLYFIGRLFSKDRLERFVDGKIGKTLRFKNDDIKKACGWFKKKNRNAVFFCRFIPIVRSLISIPAGMAKMNFFPFVLLTTFGSAIWNTVLVLFGRFAGSSWESVATIFAQYSSIAAIVLVSIFAIGLILFYKKRAYKTNTIREKNDF